jgi:transposase
MCDSGGARRTWLRGLEKVQKRYLIVAVARNLGLIMRKVFQIGTPKGLQAEGGLAPFVLPTPFNVLCVANHWYEAQPLPWPLLTPCAVAA